MTQVQRFTPPRLVAAASGLVLLAACDKPLDYDLRESFGGFSTSQAAQAATASRPRPDERGVITYPNYQVVVARRGDTVGAVARRVGVDPAELANYNGVTSGDVLREGEVLALPRKVSSGPATGSGPVDISTLAGQAIDSAPAGGGISTSTLAPSAPATPVAAAPAAGPEPIRHKVARGETAFTVSRLYQVPVKALGEWNGLDSEFTIREGQYLLIPVKVGSTTAPAPITAPGAGSSTPTPPSAARPLPDEKVSATPPATPNVSVGQPSQASSGGAMGYPVAGKIIRAYAKGKNEGIDIAATAGSPVKAAQDGTVAAITQDADKVPILVVRHQDNLLTVYANVEGIKVAKGDTVKRGQQLAQLRSGDNAYVHFEVRKGFDSVDPMPYLQ